LVGEDGSVQQFACGADTTIDEAARSAGLNVRVVCRRGGCGACQAVLLSGRVEYREPVSVTKLHLAGDDHSRCELLCRAIPVSDVTVRPILAWTKHNPHPWSDLIRKKG